MIFYIIFIASLTSQEQKKLHPNFFCTFIEFFRGID